MAGVKTLADQNLKVAILTTKPADVKAITVAELEAGIEASCQLAASDTRFTPTASETVTDAAVCEPASTSVFGSSNFEGTLAPFWYLDEKTGAYAAEDNTVYEASRTKGTRLWAVLREGPKHDQPWKTGDRYDVYEFITDTPQRPSDTGGYVKRIIPAAVQNAWLDQTVAAGA